MVARWAFQGPPCWLSLACSFFNPHSTGPRLIDTGTSFFQTLEAGIVISPACAKYGGNFAILKTRGRVMFVNPSLSWTLEGRTPGPGRVTISYLPTFLTHHMSVPDPLGTWQSKEARHQPHKVKHHHVVLNSSRHHAFNGSPLPARDSTGRHSRPAIYESSPDGCSAALFLTDLYLMQDLAQVTVSKVMRPASSSLSWFLLSKHVRQTRSPFARPRRLPTLYFA